MTLPYQTSLEGQPITVNRDSKVIIIELREMFNRAGFMFQWKSEYGSQAFGINKSIYVLLVQTKSKLLVKYRIRNTLERYWINYDTVKHFVENNSNEYHVSETRTLHNIPVALFKPKPTMVINQTND